MLALPIIIVAALRVKRFTRKSAPADASSFVYVLDLVVESEIVKP
jgi:hypothetical protein